MGAIVSERAAPWRSGGRSLPLWFLSRGGKHGEVSSFFLEEEEERGGGVFICIWV